MSTKYEVRVEIRRLRDGKRVGHIGRAARCYGPESNVAAIERALDVAKDIKKRDTWAQGVLNAWEDKMRYEFSAGSNGT